MNFPSTLITCFIKGEDGIPTFSVNNGFFYLAYPYFPWVVGYSAKYSFHNLRFYIKTSTSYNPDAVFHDIYNIYQDYYCYNEKDTKVKEFDEKHNVSKATISIQTKDITRAVTTDLGTELHAGKLNISFADISKIIGNAVSDILGVDHNRDIPYEKAPYLQSWYVSNISFIYKNSTTKLAELEVLIKDFDINLISVQKKKA